MIDIKAIISGFFSNFLTDILKFYHSKDRKKAQYEKSYESFCNTMPTLLNLLRKKDPEIWKKLITFRTEHDKVKLPIVELCQQPIQVSNRLDLNDVKYKHNNRLLNFLTSDLDKNIHDGKMFKLMGITTDNTLNVGIGSYFEQLSTSDIHYYDLIRRKLFAKKRWVEALRKIVKERDFSFYCASIAFSVLTIFKSRDGKYKIYISETSPKKGPSFSEWHVMPSFMFQPCIKGSFEEQKKELDIELSIVREFGEEMLGLKQLENPSNHAFLLEEIKKNNLLNNLYTSIKGNSDGNITLKQTGFVLDIFRMRPEITFVLIAHDPIYYEQIKLNWEAGENKSSYIIDMGDHEEYQRFIEQKHHRFVPSGLAALIKGYECARDIIN